MKKTVLFLFVLFALSTIAEAQTLSASAENYLKKNYPNWKIGESWIFESNPRKAVETGDFNGDGKTDYAVLITKDDRIYALALITTQKTFKAYNLAAQNSENRWIAGISVSPKGSEVFSEISPTGESKSFRIKNDGVYLYDGESHGRIFYWENGKFLSGNDF